MAGIASLGVGSGLDLGSLVSGLVKAERAPTENRLNASSSRLGAEISAFGQMKSTLAKLDDALAKLADLEPSRTVSVSDKAKLGVVAADDADLGSYQVEIFNLAQAQALATDALDSFTDPDAGLGAGTLTLAVGDGETVDIVIAEGEDSLRDIRDAINEANAGVNASVVKDGDAYRLLLTADNTGAANTMQLTASAGMDPRLASANMDETRAAADASFSVDGLVLSSAVNEIEDVLPGLDLTLKAATEANAPLTITIGEDTQTARKAVDRFVAVYNDAISTLDALSKYDPEKNEASTLTGDSTLRSIRAMLPDALGNDTEGGLNAIQMGLSSGMTGSLSLDADRFDDLMTEDPAALMGSLQSFGAQLGERLGGYTNADGLIDVRTEGLRNSLAGIEQRREALDLRMESVEARLTRQFSALDQLVAQLNSTSTYLQSQLESISQITTQSKRR